MLDTERSLSLELIAVVPNLKLPFKVFQTIPIEEFKKDYKKDDYKKIIVFEKT